MFVSSFWVRWYKQVKPDTPPPKNHQLCLKLVRRDKQGDLGEVAAQQGVTLQFAHLHLSLQGGRTLDGRHQEEGAGLPARALHAEVAPPAAARQAETQCVTQDSCC